MLVSNHSIYFEPTKLLIVVLSQECLQYFLPLSLLQFFLLENIPQFRSKETMYSCKYLLENIPTGYQYHR